MTKDELFELFEMVLEEVGCGCCGNWDLVRKNKREAVEEIWNEMEKLKHRRPE